MAPTSLASQALLASALARTASAIFIADREGRVIWVNQAFCTLCGYAKDELLGQTPEMLKSGKQDAAFYAELWRSVLAGNTWHGELVDRRKDGSFYSVEEVITPLLDDQGNVEHFIAIQHDVTQLRQEIERHHHLANHDALTGLPNRALFFKVLKEAIANARKEGTMFALLYLDLDKFKPVNDTLGHHLGDLLLVNVAKRLRASVRDSDTVARLGGDEFAIIVHKVADATSAAALARTLLQTVAQPFMLEGHALALTASIGIALFPRDADDPDHLLRSADQAMYVAKSRGENCYHVSDSHRFAGHVHNCHTLQ